MAKARKTVTRSTENLNRKVSTVHSRHVASAPTTSSLAATNNLSTWAAIRTGLACWAAQDLLILGRNPV
jgi:hypothetical protein